MYVYTYNLWKSTAVLYVIPQLSKQPTVLTLLFYIALEWSFLSPVAFMKFPEFIKFLPTDLQGWKLWEFRSGIFILSEISYFEAWLPSSTLFLLRGEIPH